MLRAIRRHLPRESLLYLGDTARVPYGTRSRDTVIRYSLGVASQLVEHGIKMLVVACNTASTHALEALRRAASPLGIPVLGVIEPGVDRAIQATRNGHVAVIGTEGTIRGARYQRLLMERRPGIRVSAVACPLFVALAEEGWLEGTVPDLVANRYLQPLRDGPDTVILGCTHYPLLKGAISRALPGVELVDSADAMAVVVERELSHLELARPSPDPPKTSYLVTDSPRRFETVGSRFLDQLPSPVELVDVTPMASSQGSAIIFQRNGP